MGNHKIHNRLTQAVARKIRSRREALKFSQEEFADYITLDRANYGAIERGERNISITTLVRIAVGLKLEVGDLFPRLNEITELI